MLDTYGKFRSIVKNSYAQLQDLLHSKAAIF